jgi:hypothetical protein
VLIIQEILVKIYNFHEEDVQHGKVVGNCAICNDQVSQLQEDLVYKFWMDFCNDPQPNIYIDLVVNCESLSPVQFNSYNEPMLCISCLRDVIHKE